MRPLLATVVAATSVTPQRGWFEQLAFVVPGPAASRWLLLADAVCLVALGRRTRRPLLGVLFALGLGFILLIGLGLALTDFYLAVPRQTSTDLLRSTEVLQAVHRPKTPRLV
jgi:hypothetical protein